MSFFSSLYVHLQEHHEYEMHRTRRGNYVVEDCGEKVALFFNPYDAYLFMEGRKEK